MDIREFKKLQKELNDIPRVMQQGAGFNSKMVNDFYDDKKNEMKLQWELVEE